MKRTILDIIDAILFIIALSFTIKILIHFGINFNILHVVAGLLVVWVSVKMALRKLLSNKKDSIDRNI